MKKTVIGFLYVACVSWACVPDSHHSDHSTQGSERTSAPIELKLKAGGTTLKLVKDDPSQPDGQNSPRPAAELPNDEKCQINLDSLSLSEPIQKEKNGHYLIRIANAYKCQGAGQTAFQKAWVYKGHTLANAGSISNGQPLKIPYLLQFGGNGECQITSVTMVRRYLKGTEHSPLISELRPKKESLKSWVYIGSYFKDQGYNVIRHYNNSSGENNLQAEEKMRRHLDDGAAIILHIFTRLGGHVVVLGGYDQSGWLVFDPAGHDFNRAAAGEYRDSTTGEWRATKPDHVSFADMRLKGAYSAGVGRGANVGYMYNAIFKTR